MTPYDPNDPATQAGYQVALDAMADAIGRCEAAGVLPSEIVSVLLLTAAHGAYSHGMTAEDFRGLAVRAWVEMRCARGAR